MKRILCLIIALCTATTVFASDVKLVSRKWPFMAFFDFFKNEEVQPVTATNQDKPITANNGRLNVNTDEATDGKLSYTSDEYSDVTFVISNPPKMGEITINDNKLGTFTYTPSKGAKGEDSFEFTVSADDGISDTATVTVIIGEESEEKTEQNTAPKTDFEYEDMYNHWGQYAALQLADKNILKGMEIRGKYYFYPETLMTRTDFIVLLISALDIDISSAREIGNPFSDASEIPGWANLYVKTAYDAGIIDGALENGNLYFRPNDVLTRIEIIKILDKTIKPDTVSVNDAQYNDMYLVPAWGVQSVKNMTDYGILNGYDDNTIRPYVKINKAMAAEFILQVLNYKEQNPVMMRQIYTTMNS